MTSDVTTKPKLALYWAASCGGCEIAVLDIASSKVTELTRNDSPDRFPLFSHDGKRVYFEARNVDPVFGARRAVSRIAWVPL